MKKLVLIGGGGHCKACIDVIEQTKQFEIVGILDKAERFGENILSYSINGTDDDISFWVKKNAFFLITLGQIKSPSLRIKLASQLDSAGAELATVISPRSYVASSVRIGEGSIIMHDAVLNTEVSIGRHCIINTKALIEHETRIGDYCHISTGAVLNGQVIAGSRIFVGSQVVVNNNIAIADDIVVPSGYTVRKNISKREFYYE